MERLQKFIAECGVASRRAAEKMIADGRVSVNGIIVDKQGVSINSTSDTVQIDGKAIKKSEEKIYIILYKPRGYISTVKDERGRKTVVSLIKNVSARIFPVGRLDYNTEGLLLLTNDGSLTQQLLHPKFKIEKTYVATIEGRLESKSLGRLRHGIMLDDGITAPAKVEIIKYDEKINRSKVQLIIHEGRNRQVRRMLSAAGHDVLALKRTCFAGLTLHGLKRGKYRSLTADELTKLMLVINGDCK